MEVGICFGIFWLAILAFIVLGACASIGGTIWFIFYCIERSKRPPRDR